MITFKTQKLVDMYPRQQSLWGMQTEISHLALKVMSYLEAWADPKLLDYLTPEVSNLIHFHGQYRRHVSSAPGDPDRSGRYEYYNGQFPAAFELMSNLKIALAVSYESDFISSTSLSFDEMNLLRWYGSHCQMGIISEFYSRRRELIIELIKVAKAEVILGDITVSHLLERLQQASDGIDLTIKDDVKKTIYNKVFETLQHQ